MSQEEGCGHSLYGIIIQSVKLSHVKDNIVKTRLELKVSEKRLSKMQRGPDKTSRIFLIVALLALAIITVLYYIKRSEVNGIFEKAKMEKKLSYELGVSLNHKLNEQAQKLKTMQQQIDNYKTQINKCEDQLLVSDKEMDSKEKLVRQCNQEHQDTKKLLTTCQEELQQLKGSSRKSQEDLEAAKSEAQTAQKNLAKCQEAKKVNSDCLSELQLVRTNLRTCNTQCNKQLGNNNDDMLQTRNQN